KRPAPFLIAASNQRLRGGHPCSALWSMQFFTQAGSDGIAFQVTGDFDQIRAYLLVMGLAHTLGDRVQSRVWILSHELACLSHAIAAAFLHVSSQHPLFAHLTIFIPPFLGSGFA